MVLVHGMYHGGWAWQVVARRLQTAGIPVFTPTLTGLGERAHLLTQEVNFTTHVRDVVALIEFEDLEDVVLVGHSYGGEVAHGVLHSVPERIGHIVYLDSAHFDRTTFDGEVTPGPPPARPTGVEGVLCYPIPDDGPLFGVRDPADLAWMTPKLTPHPALTRSEPRSFAPIEGWSVRRTYIACLIDLDGITPISEPREVWRRVIDDEAYEFREIIAPHDAMITHPEALAELLRELRGE
jgi:pimeloyl-ACP methyl ester carboxylesterase